ncbi:complement C1q-like protein 3 isoform X2 [Mytilus californianus]|uniref:complement C1q-like protein 3 isoform X2 n=1 Tax=Mytilus californianus TaxID=6549 RepID=UPI002246AB8A|nr:complement C1q-like protein 3 isoform X2 [Mytilus californianus]
MKSKMVSTTLVLLLLCANLGKALASCNPGKTTCVTEDLLHMIMRAGPTLKDDLERRPTFFASLKTSQTLSNIRDIVKFDDAKINIGGGYDSTTGIFTAPRNGIYIFSCAIMANGGGEVHFQLNKNDQLYTAGYATKSNYGAQTVNSLVELRTGDKVYVKHRNGSSQNVLGSHFSTFSGYLLSK